MKTKILQLIALLAAIIGSGLLVAAWLLRPPTSPDLLPSEIVVIGNTQVQAWLPQTLADYELGLGNRPSLPKNEGMLFRYKQKQPVVFWMKGMQFPLDFIWIADGTVIDLTENVQPGLENGQYTMYSPKQPADNVLEVNAGFIRQHSIKLGEKVELN